jgi:peroxiredoxin
MLELGTRAPDFTLPGTDGASVSLGDFEGSSGLLVAFICNHCPYVVHLQGALRDYADEYADSELAIVAISSNSAKTHPEDGPEEMAVLADDLGWGFPYLHDETQAVAKAHQAACTPEFYLFDEEHRLVYRGQFDESRPGNGVAITGTDLYAATHALLAGAPVEPDQVPSVGCNIKWHPGEAPNYRV